MQITPNNANTNDKLVFPDLSYKIVGASFKVFNNLGWGLPEKDYGRALALELGKLNLNYKREIYIPLKYDSENISRYFADFIIENKILLELKVAPKLGYIHAKQVLSYLRNSSLKLGILIYFTKDGIKYRRILNSFFKD